MTFEQLEKKYGKQERVDWKQYENGGGWVHKSATITDKVFVGENAIVWSGVIYGTARISGGGVMDNQYVIHDAEKEKPKDSRAVLGCVNSNYWVTVYYYPPRNRWYTHYNDTLCNVTHWTDLPPDPPKPRRWVKKEEESICEILKDGLRRHYLVLEASVRNVKISWEIEEEQS